MSYGSNIAERYRELGRYADRILNASGIVPGQCIIRNIYVSPVFAAGSTGSRYLDIRKAIFSSLSVHNPQHICVTCIRGSTPAAPRLNASAAWPAYVADYTLKGLKYGFADIDYLLKRLENMALRISTTC
jgi:hypothetical protein